MEQGSLCGKLLFLKRDLLLNPETYAIVKADMMLKGDGEEALHIAFGSTLSSDQHATRTFDFMLANPPYGKSWKIDADRMATGDTDLGEAIIALPEKMFYNTGIGT